MVPPAMSGVRSVMRAERRAALLASPICPSSRFTKTGFREVTESIQSRVGSGAPSQRSWSQSPPRIHSPGFRVAANALRRATNSCGVSASRRSTLASWKPPLEKWAWPSMKPGVTSDAPCWSTRVAGPTYAPTVALSPTATISSPVTATAPAQGAAESPVQTRPKTTRSAAGGGEMSRSRPASEQPAARRARAAARTKRSVMECLSAQLGETAECLELLERGPARRGGRRHRKEVADVEEDLQHELVAHVGPVELRHARVLAAGPGTIVGLAVDRLQIGQYAVAGAHGGSGRGR